MRSRKSDPNQCYRDMTQLDTQYTPSLLNAELKLDKSRDARSRPKCKASISLLRNFGGNFIIMRS